MEAEGGEMIRFYSSGIGKAFSIFNIHFGFNPYRWKTGFCYWKGINMCTVARGKTISFSAFQITLRTTKNLD